jgi:hypothetical protein
LVAAVWVNCSGCISVAQGTEGIIFKLLLLAQFETFRNLNGNFALWFN